MKELREDRRPADLWFWSDWFSSIDVRSCSLAAQGLWVNMLGIMSRADRKGFLSINGKQMDSRELAKFVGEFKDKVEELLVELEYYKVFSRAEDGTIYNRRMVNESELSRKRAEAGRKGGSSKQNPSKTEASVSSKHEATLESDNEDDSSSSIKEEDFNQWWAAYPRKIAKKVAAKAYASAVKAGASPQDLLRAVEGYRAELKRRGTQEDFCLHASTFLHEDRWRDYLDIKVPLEVGSTPPDVAASVRRAVERNRKNFECLKEDQ